MGLRLRLKPHERIIINGCVVTNGDRRNTIEVSSFGQVIKSKDIMQPDEATTPMRRLYFAIQNALIDPAKARESYVPVVNKLAAIIFAQSADDDLETRTEIMRAMDFVHLGDYYKALSRIRPLIADQPSCLPPAGPAAAGRFAERRAV